MTSDFNMYKIRCFLTKNILDGEARDYYLSFALNGESCVIIAMGDGPAQMNDFCWMGWDKLRLRLPEPDQIQFIGNVGRWDWSPDASQWQRTTDVKAIYWNPYGGSLKP